MLGGLRDLDVRSHIPHAQTATDRTNHQEPSSSELIDEEEKIDDGSNGLDDSKQASGKQRCVCALNTNALEYRGRIIIDGVDTRSVLPEEEHSSKEESPLDVFIAGEELERLPEPLATSSFLTLDVLIHGVYFFLNINIICR